MLMSVHSLSLSLLPLKSREGWWPSWVQNWWSWYC